MILRGLGYGAASWEARYSVAELQRLKNAGMNALTLQYFWEAFENQDSTVQNISARVKYAKKY
jgi:hypothetical protein